MPFTTVRYPPLQPAHHSDRITVEQAMRAFREVEMEERRARRNPLRNGRRGRAEQHPTHVDR